MISTLSMSHYKGMPVNLPQGRLGQQSPAESTAITITKEGQIFLDKQPVEKPSLGALLREQIVDNPDTLVIINADDGAEHGEAVEVMDTARRASVAKIAIAVEPKEPKQ